MVNVDEGFAGKIVTVFIDHTSAGATTETISLPTGAPKFDMSQPHPVISGAYLSTEGDDITETVILLPENEGIRGFAVAEAVNGKWDIVDLDTIAFYLTANVNGVMALTYWAAGMQKQ